MNNQLPSANQGVGRGLTRLAIGLLVSLRPKQWTKNVTVYAPLLFTIREAWDPQDLNEALTIFGKVTLAFLILCAMSGAIYLINDVADVDRDRHHPKKRLRPIAAGQVPLGIAKYTSFVIAALSLAMSFYLEPLFGGVILGYLVLMVAYTFVIKQLVLLDVFAISGGFVLRVVAGAAVILVPISPWLYICVGTGALFIALAKRRGEYASAGEANPLQRETLGMYSVALLDQLVGIVATSVLLAYSLYTFTAPNLPDNHLMMLTIPFVVYGLFRYMYLVQVRYQGENPEDIFVGDLPLVLSIGGWLVSIVVILTVSRG